MTEDERGLWERRETARKELILFYVPLVKVLAKRIARNSNWANLDDMVQDGVVGLIRAIVKFDPSQGTPFVAFARQYIRGAIFDGMERSRGMARKPEELYRKVRRAEAELTKTLRRNPTIEEVAEETGLNLEQIKNAIDAMGLAFAGEFPDAEEPTALSGVQTANQERDAMIEESLSHLNKRQQEIVGLYYWENLTDKEIAARLGLTVDNTAKIRRRALDKLRKRLDVKKKGGQDNDR
jgi:RNA polymerase sigma factor for flagellar operon FliA